MTLELLAALVASTLFGPCVLASTQGLVIDRIHGGITSIPAIQGPGATSPRVGTTVTTQGVVTKVLNNGFFLQDPVGDNDPLTSDGILVFTSTTPTVQAGQSVRLTGSVTEYNTGAASNPDTAAHTVTELTNVSGLTVLGTAPIPAPGRATLVGVSRRPPADRVSWP